MRFRKLDKAIPVKDSKSRCISYVNLHFDGNDKKDFLIDIYGSSLRTYFLKYVINIEKENYVKQYNTWSSKLTYEDKLKYFKIIDKEI